jgi:hypothetical protein
MLGVFFEGVSRVIYCSHYVGLSGIGHNFEEAIFLTSTSKSRVITTSTLLRQLILRYEDSVRDPQTVGYCSRNYKARGVSGKKYEAQIVIFCILVAVNRFSRISQKVGKPLKKVRKPLKKSRKPLKKAESR